MSSPMKTWPMSDGHQDKSESRVNQDADSTPSSTLLPMLIGGLVLIIIGMIVVMMFA
jgi:hypothetical protein